MTESNTAVRNKKRLLRLLRYLYEYTDEENPVSYVRIGAILTA